MAQSAITRFFQNRKRPALDDLKGKRKVTVMSDVGTDTGYSALYSSENLSISVVTPVKEEKAVVCGGEFSNESPKPKPQGLNVAKPKSTPRPRKTSKPKDAKQQDMTRFLKSTSEPKSSSGTKSSPCNPTPKVEVSDASDTVNKQVADRRQTPVKMESEGLEKMEEPTGVSDAKEETSVSGTTHPKTEMNIAETQVTLAVEGKDVSSVEEELSPKAESNKCDISTKMKASNVHKDVSQPKKKENNVEKARRELSLGDIRSKLTRSARLAELKASLARFDDGREKLNRIEQAKKNNKASPAKPQLAQFNSLELEVPASPSKSPMKSPMKSPQKLPAGCRSPAFQRYASLAQPSTPALTLPFNYRLLAERFRCVDSVVSLLFNRKEVITFKKLQQGVQEMSRSNFAQSHLAQMLTIFPEAYTLKQEKLHNFGSPSQHDKYQLIITPVIDTEVDGKSNGSPSMTPSLILERRRRFYHNLLDLVKQHHEKFLQSLDPPLVIPQDSLTRWHPEFAVDQVPDVPASALPQPPNLEKCFSAKDVLAKARQLYSCNARMEKALESVARPQSDNGGNNQPQNVHIEVVNAPSPAPSNPPTSPFKSLQLSSTLKGIPKAVLEKVRAREAAKALEAMTRTSAQDKEAAQHSRLPDLARILRNVFVAEKRGALQLETVLEKVGNSYRTAMSQRELEDHLRLMAKAVPGWITFEHLLKTDYIRLSKKTELNRVMKRLEDLAREKLGTSK